MTSPETADADAIYLEYGACVQELLGVPLGKARLHLAGSSYAPVPLQSDTGGVLYQNYSIYNIGNIIPRDDIPLLSRTGGSFVAAYQAYLDNIDLSTFGGINNPGQITVAEQKVAAARTLFLASVAQADAAYKALDPPGLDPVTGASITQFQFLQTYYPDAVAQENAVISDSKYYGELLQENSGNKQVTLLSQYTNAAALGMDSQNPHQLYNMPAFLSSGSNIINVANGSSTPCPTPSSYVPAFALGGEYDSQTSQWIKSFPNNYPQNTSDYDAGVQKVLTINVTKSTSKTWTDLGYSTSTSYSGTDGWVFWSHEDKTTNTTSHTNVTIKKTSFTSDITMKVWRYGTFDLNYGSWYTSNPIDQFPVLVKSATADTTIDVQQQFTTLLFAYGIEYSFSLEQDAFQSLQQAASQAQSSDNSLSILGTIYSNGDSSSSSASQSFDSLKFDANTNTVTMLATNNKVPIVLGALAVPNY